MRVSPNPMTTSVLAGGEDTDAGERPRENGGGDWSHSARSPGVPGVPDVGRDRKDLLQSLQRA